MQVDDAISKLVAWLQAIEPAAARAFTAETAGKHSGRAAAAMSAAPVTERALRRIAYHEAAHAVAAAAQGLRVRRAFLGSGYAGVELDGDEPVWSAIAQLAGPALELVANVDDERQCALASSFDLQAARVSIADSGVLTPRTAAIAAVTIVNSHLAEIRRVAAALEALGELRTAEVEALCQPLQ
jgi:hypothetical protein